MQFLKVLLLNFFSFITFVHSQDLKFSVQHFCQYDQIIKKNASCPSNLNVEELENFSKPNNEWKVDIKVDLLIKILFLLLNLK